MYEIQQVFRYVCLSLDFHIALEAMIAYSRQHCTSIPALAFGAMT